LADLNFDFPKDVYPIGRLDLDSEGLLLLTNDRKLNHTLLNPQFQHERTYLAQVENIFSENAIEAFENGLEIKVEKKPYQTLPAKVRLVDDPSVESSKTVLEFFGGNPVWSRNPPAKASANQPMSWIEVTLTEGKNRQVRRMCAKVNHPCLRLIRVKIKDLLLADLETNEVRELDREEVYQKLGLKE
jgi:23S rRNA pseudouridine2457 synthase